MMGRKLQFGLRLSGSELLLVLFALRDYQYLHEEKMKLIERFQEVDKRYADLMEEEYVSPIADCLRSSATIKDST